MTKIIVNLFLNCIILDNSEKVKRYTLKQKDRGINSQNSWTKTHLKSPKFCPVRRVRGILQQPEFFVCCSANHRFQQLINKFSKYDMNYMFLKVNLKSRLSF